MDVMLADQLAAAVLGRDERQVRRLLDAGADANGLDSTACWPLCHAIFPPLPINREVVRMLIAAGANVNVEDFYYSERHTPLMMVAGGVQMDLPTLRMLLDAGANPNYSVQGSTAINIATGCNHEAAVRLLLQHGAEVNGRDGGQAPIYIAARWSPVSMVQLLLQHGACVNASDQYGLTPLMRAAGRPDPAVMETLIKSAADIDQRCPPLFWTAIMFAASVGRVDAALILAKCGASLKGTVDACACFGHPHGRILNCTQAEVLQFARRPHDAYMYALRRASMRSEKMGRFLLPLGTVRKCRMPKRPW